MSAKNDITGDSIITKSSTDKYRDGWERIFGKQKREMNECDTRTNKTSDSAKQQND